MDQQLVDRHKVNQQLILLRLVEAPERNGPLQVHCWCGDGWRPVALDDSFSRGFNADCAIAAAPADAIQLDFPEGSRALLLVPGSWLWCGLEVIPRAARRQSGAVGYMVEDHLAEDVEDLHFVCQPRSGDLCSVYAISREKMHALSSQLRRLNWPVAAAVPEYQLLNLLDADINLWLDGDCAHIWHKAGRGLSVNRQYLQPLLEGLEASMDDADGSREAVQGEAAEQPSLQLLGAGEADALSLAELQSRFGEGFARIDGSPEEHLLAHYKPERLANLLSGDYQLEQGTEEQLWWRKPALIAGACFALQLLLFVAAGSYYQWQANRAETQAQALFSEIFPNSRPQEDLRRQIEGYLTQTGGGSGNFSRQMQLLSSVWGQHKGGELKLQSLRFDGNRGEMVLQLRAATLADLDATVGRLSNGEFKADLLAANELEKGVSGRIRLR